jgi:hypothetical protein
MLSVSAGELKGAGGELKKPLCLSGGMRYHTSPGKTAMIAVQYTRGHK